VSEGALPGLADVNPVTVPEATRTAKVLDCPPDDWVPTARQNVADEQEMEFNRVACAGLDLANTVKDVPVHRSITDADSLFPTA
jgi:hypothetical protein